MFEPGRIEAVDLGRQFRVATGQGRSLKATLLRREASAIHEFWALRHVNLEIEPGETFGIVGRNGSGKSTFLKMLARIYGPSEGSCRVGGRMSSLLELGAGFHPEFNAVENIFLAGSVYGIPKNELKKDVDEIIAFAELEQFAYQPIKTYSSGMFMRLGFSVAMHVRPDVLLLDEVLAVGDERFIQKCLTRIAQYRRDGGTMLLVTHDPGTVQRLCQRAMLLNAGEVVTISSAEDVIAQYHRLLANESDPANLEAPDVQGDVVFEIDVSVFNSGNVRQKQFVEGDTIIIRVHMKSHVTANTAILSVEIKDELGRSIGSQSSEIVSFASAQERSLELILNDSPLRNGLFQVDARILDALAGTTLLDAPAMAAFSVYGDGDRKEGTIRLGGTWKECLR
jgi:ABC-type polysaccharide/polyol phosphate transport system ATPase subunit